jgi:hypothetical protein
MPSVEGGDDHPGKDGSLPECADGIADVLRETLAEMDTSQVWQYIT